MVGRLEVTYKGEANFRPLESWKDGVEVLEKGWSSDLGKGYAVHLRLAFYE